MRIFGPKKDEVTGEWKRLHNGELYDLCSSPSIIKVIKSRRIRWAGHVARMENRIGACMVSVERPERRSALEKPRCKCEDDIKMDPQEVGWEAWTALIWLRMEKGGGRL
jgi:hypothetical protein